MQYASVIVECDRRSSRLCFWCATPHETRHQQNRAISISL